jgi:hypothetical protein
MPAVTAIASTPPKPDPQGGSYRPRAAEPCPQRAQPKEENQGRGGDEEQRRAVQPHNRDDRGQNGADGKRYAGRSLHVLAARISGNKITFLWEVMSC